jgi:hypothetical protein
MLAVGQSPAPAAAASGIIEVSDNGVNFSSTYSGALFDDLTRLVPGDSQQSVFYVRNASSETGMLRITLGDVTVTDTDYADALTVSASTNGYTGIAATVLSANPCWVLLEGQVVGPGQIVAVTATMMLGELHGKAGQGASAGLTIGVALSDAAVGALPPTECGRTDVPIPVIPQPAPTNRPGADGSTTGGEVGAAVDEAQVIPDLPVLNLPGGIRIDPNTWHLYEELLVLVLIGASVLGGGWFAFLAWRRRHGEEEESDVIA